MAKIGFIGLGIMGRPMAKNLMKAGHVLVVSNRSRAAVDDLVALGASAAATPADIAGGVDILVTMLPNGPDVREVVLGPNGVLAGAREGLIYVDMSSIAPGTAQEIGAAVAKKGVIMFDAPVSGGEPKAIEGSLAIMVGGPEEVFETIKPILLCMGASAVHVGALGAGNITKLANQVIVGANIAALSEALVLAKKAGADPQKVVDAIAGGLAGSTVLNAKAPMMLAGNFKPGFRIELHVKDLTNAADTGEAADAPLPLTGAVLDMMLTLTGRGEGGNDHSGLVRYYEDLAGVTVKD